MNDVNFLPDRIRQQRDRRQSLVRQGYLLVACVLAMALLTYVRAGRISQAKADLHVLQDRCQNVQRQISLIPPLERQLADLNIKKRIDGELGSRTDCTAVLSELCRVMPANMALLSLDLKTVECRPEVKPANGDPRNGTKPVSARKGDEEAIRRVRVLMTGVAPTDVDVANFIGQIAACCLFEDVNMGYAKSVPFHGRVAREFQASFYLAK